MPQPSAEQLADLLWRRLRPQAVALLDAALGAQKDSPPADGLTTEDDARIDAWLARQRHRQRDRRPAQQKRTSTQPERSSTSSARGAS